MKNKINLNKEVSIDIPKLIEGGMVILANSGGGKSYAIRKIAEEAVGQVQTIILDPEGEFASLREKYDFILAGKNADVPVEVRSASLLATRLLELGKSAVIDLYELHPQERQRYVKLFCEALVNCSKDLYHPVLIILDEAHEYVPEGKPSEATWAVESLASKGRKRGQRLILASQRISKLSKNASAECNNKLIGRASQDIDMKRAGDELGFNKESLKDLRQLKPGEFFAFGSAISDDVIKLKIGEVKTAHAKVGYKGGAKTPPPSDVIKKVLGELADLPHEAEKELKTVADLKQEVARLKKLATIKNGTFIEKQVADPKAIEIAVKNAVKETERQMNQEFWVERDEWLKQIQNWFGILKGVGEMMQDLSKKKIVKVPIYKADSAKLPEKEFIAPGTIRIIPPPVHKEREYVYQKEMPSAESMGNGEKTIYSFLVEKEGVSRSKTQVAIATGYSQSSGGFNNSISKLAARGLIVRAQGGQLSFPEGARIVEELIVPVDASLEKWLTNGKLGGGAKKILALMLDHHRDETWTKEQIANETGYSATSGGFNNSISELSALGLVERLPGGVIRINAELNNL